MGSLSVKKAHVTHMRLPPLGLRVCLALQTKMRFEIKSQKIDRLGLRF